MCNFLLPNSYNKFRELRKAFVWSLSKNVFLSDARQLEVRLLLFYMPCHATKFVLLSVFTLIDDLPNNLAKPWPKNTNIPPVSC